MTLPLELGQVTDAYARRALEQLALHTHATTSSSPSPPVDAVRLVGTAGEPAFQNSWTNYDTAGFASAGFYLDRNRVYLQGMIKPGTFGYGTPAFTLPASYWPPKLLIFNVRNQSGIHRVDVAPNGEVRMTPEPGSATWVNIDSVHFRVA